MAANQQVRAAPSSSLVRPQRSLTVCWTGDDLRHQEQRRTPPQGLTERRHHHLCVPILQLSLVFPFSLLLRFVVHSKELPARKEQYPSEFARTQLTRIRRNADPGSAATALLPLTIANNYRPEVLFCGGTTANLDINPSQLSAKYPASKQCSRMALDGAGVKKGWVVEEMPSPRVMGDAILMPDATVLIVNGAAAGVAGCASKCSH